MKKLTLELDALKVESFRTGAVRNIDGTVQGHESDWDEEAPGKSVGCSDGCTAYSCASGGDVCCG